MIIARELPQNYEAIQFDMAFASKYGLIKYPMLTRCKHSVYGDTHKHLSVNPLWIAPNNDNVSVVGDGVVDMFNRENGIVRIYDDRGMFAVKAPVVQNEHSEGWLARVFGAATEKTYDFDSPELNDYVYHYYLGSKMVNHNDWIVTDSQGKSKVYAPDEFQERFETSDKTIENEK